MPQHVAVELCRHACAVVVGALDDRRVFLQVDADEERAAGAGFLVHDQQQFVGRVVGEIADRRAGKVNDVAHRHDFRRRQLERLCKVGDDRQHVEIRKFFTKLFCRLEQVIF